VYIYKTHSQHSTFKTNNTKVQRTNVSLTLNTQADSYTVSTTQVRVKSATIHQTTFDEHRPVKEEDTNLEDKCMLSRIINMLPKTLHSI